MSTNDNKLNFLKYATVTVALGILASALWDYMFASSLSWIYKKCIYILESIGSGYMDLLYKSASNGFHESTSLLTNNFIYFTLAIFSILAGVAYIHQVRNISKDIKELNSIVESTESKSKIIGVTKEDNAYNNAVSPFSESDDPVSLTAFKTKTFEIIKVRKKARLRIKIQVFVLVLSLLSCLFTISHTTIVQDIQVRTLNNIEIVSPYISDIEYKQLKSDFHSMDSRSDYEKLNETMSDIANNNGIKLK